MNHQIHLGTRKLYAEYIGKGCPTVVIEVGSTRAGTKDEGWYPLREALARETSVLMYDRAGLGDSDPVALPRPISEFTADLHAVLTAAPVEKPYLLVGGSFGGLIVTHYASLHPENVAGIVLIDSTHPEHNQRALALLPPPAPGESRALANFRNLLWQETYAPLSTLEEGLDFPASVTQMRANWALGDIALTVLTAGQDEWEAGFPQEAAYRYEQLWLTLQRELADRSSRSTHIIVNESSHCIHAEKPEAVLEAINGLLRQIKECVIALSVDASREIQVSPAKTNPIALLL